jgi:hypothetical protein
MENYESSFFFTTKTKNYHNNKVRGLHWLFLPIFTNNNGGIAFLLPELGKNEFATSIVLSFVLQEC